VAAESVMGEGSRFTLEIPEGIVEQAGKA
jgi:hypothetical protein